MDKSTMRKLARTVPNYKSSICELARPGPADKPPICKLSRARTTYKLTICKLALPGLSDGSRSKVVISKRGHKFAPRPDQTCYLLNRKPRL